MSAQEIFIGRQPILDREQQLYAYELLFRSGAQNRAQVTDDLAATATVLSHVFSELGLEAALGPYLGFVNLDARMLASDAIELLPREKFVLEVLETVDITPEVVSRCRELKEKGFTLALDDFVAFEERHKPLLELADIVKVDLMGMEAAALHRTVAALRPWKVRLLAEKVDDEAQVKVCRELGFELFQGYYFAKPAIIAGKKLSHSELVLMRLLGLVLDDADTPQIEDVFKQAPGLTLNLMRLTNSAASGLRQKIASLRHAITVLGRRQLQRWLQLLLFTNPSGGGANPLLQLAATRGRFLELLAGDLMGVEPRLRGPRLHDRHHVADAGPAAGADRRDRRQPQRRAGRARGAGAARRRAGQDAAAGRAAGGRRHGVLLRPRRRAARSRQRAHQRPSRPSARLGQQHRPAGL
ncbi:hypothetical protein MASR1M97_11910 [Candidatus Desulfobacillus denitrificans]